MGRHPRHPNGGSNSAAVPHLGEDEDGRSGLYRYDACGEPIQAILDMHSLYLVMNDEDSTKSVSPRSSLRSDRSNQPRYGSVSLSDADGGDGDVHERGNRSSGASSALHSLHASVSSFVREFSAVIFTAGGSEAVGDGITMEDADIASVRQTESGRDMEQALLLDTACAGTFDGADALQNIKIRSAETTSPSRRNSGQHLGDNTSLRSPPLVLVIGNGNAAAESAKADDVINTKLELGEEKRSGFGLPDCCICYGASATVAYLPCGHVVNCVECAGEVRKPKARREQEASVSAVEISAPCPICRVHVQAMVVLGASHVRMAMVLEKTLK